MKTIITYGEVLWDCLPEGIFLGGAPLNTGCHLARLGAYVFMVSAVGPDVLGNEAHDRMEERGVDTRFVFQQGNFPTGTVKVTLDGLGNPTYKIKEEVAWDYIKIPPRLKEMAAGVDAIIYGSLAQRSLHNRESFPELMEGKQPLKVFDVNLRPPYDDVRRALYLARLSDVIKLNEEELFALVQTPPGEMSLEDAIARLAEKAGKDRICVTLGERGAVYHNGSGLQWGKAPVVEVKDAVGAGDAFLAAFTLGILNGDEKTDPDFIDRCCRLGAFVASRSGAIPDYDPAMFLK